MTAKEIYMGTMRFNWMKFGISVLTFVLSCLALAVIIGVLSVIGGGFIYLIGFVFWLGIVQGIRFFLRRALGYIVKAGHIAVIAEAIQTGKIPEHSFSIAKETVTKRFGATASFFVIDSLVAGAVKQIQRIVGKVGGLMDFVPGMGFLVQFVQYFVEYSLGYIDECCLGYVFLNEDQSAFKSAADGVVIYAQNWKHLLKNAAKITGVVIVAMILISIFIYSIFGGVFRLFGFGGLIGLVLAIFVAGGIKYAFIDSWILVATMTAYMEVAPTTEISYDLYGKLCGMSKKFKELFEKVQIEKPAFQKSQVAVAGVGRLPLDEVVDVKKANFEVSSIQPTGTFCKQCGGSIGAGDVFCGNCGTRVNAEVQAEA